MEHQEQITYILEIASLTQTKIDKLIEDDVWKLQKQRIQYLTDKNSKLQQMLESRLFTVRQDMEVKFKHVQTFVETQVKETHTLVMEKRKEREGQDTSITQMVVTVQERLDSEVAKLSEKI